MPSTFDKALAREQAGDLAQASRLYVAALKQEPIRAAHNLGSIAFRRGDHATAERYFRAALRAKPDFPLSAHSLSVILLTDGRFEEGWRLHEARRRIVAANPVHPPSVWPSLTAPEWRGEPLDGKRVLVVGEQGLGDQIMFARFGEQLRTHGADVVQIVDPSLQRLFPGSAPLLREAQPPAADYWTLAATLPHRLRTTIETLPPPRIAHPPLRQGGGIGVMPTGRPTHHNDAERSLHAHAADLLALGRDLRPAATGARDFWDTAEIVAGLDLIVTVDTALAHLAASMGKPTWILLPALRTDWRWMRDRTDSPWYPSARLFRQRAPGDWMGVLDEVRAALG